MTSTGLAAGADPEPTMELICCRSFGRAFTDRLSVDERGRCRLSYGLLEPLHVGQMASILDAPLPRPEHDGHLMPITTPTPLQTTQRMDCGCWILPTPRQVAQAVPYVRFAFIRWIPLRYSSSASSSSERSSVSVRPVRNPSLPELLLESLSDSFLWSGSFRSGASVSFVGFSGMATLRSQLRAGSVRQRLWFQLSSRHCHRTSHMARRPAFRYPGRHIHPSRLLQLGAAALTSERFVTRIRRHVASVSAK